MDRYDYDVDEFNFPTPEDEEFFPEDWEDYADERQNDCEWAAEALFAQWDDDPNPYAGTGGW